MSTCFAWKFGQKRHFVYVLYLCTHEWIEYAAGHLLHISRVHARQVQKSCFFTFNYNVWVNAFCHKFVAYMSSTRCWGSCWQQQLNGTPNLRTVKQMLKSTKPADFWQCSCTACSILFFSWVKQTKFQFSSMRFYIFMFMVTWQRKMHQQLQKICGGEACRIKSFRAKLRKFGKISFAPLKIPCSYTCSFKDDL